MGHTCLTPYCLSENDDDDDDDDSFELRLLWYLNLLEGIREKRMKKVCGCRDAEGIICRPAFRLTRTHIHTQTLQQFKVKGKIKDCRRKE